MKLIAPEEYLAQTLSLRNQIEGSFLILGERLNKIHEEKLWSGHYESYGEFLADMKITEATASRLTTVYQTYVVERGVPIQLLAKAGWSSLYTAIPLLADQSSEDVVDKAISLRRKDLELEVKEGKNPCSHPETFQVEVCRDCHIRL